MTLSAVLSVSLLAACGPTNETTTAQPPAQTGTPAGTDAPEGTDAPSTEEVTLNIAMIADDYPVHDLAELYMEEHDNVKIERTEVPNNEFMDKMIVQLSGGSDIDMYWVSNNANYADFISKGLAEPLDDYIAKDNLDMTPYGVTYDNIKVDGTVYQMPTRNSIWVLYYNKDLFDAAGVDYPTGSMTYQEYRDLAKKMTSGSGQDKIWGAYIHTWPIAWNRYALQSGSTIIDTDLSPFVEAMQYRLDLEADGSIMPYTEQVATSAHYRTEFLKGNLAMHVMGDFHVGQLRQAENEGELNFDWDIVASPVPEGVSENTTTGMTGGFSINPKSEAKDVAWDFLKYISGETGANHYVKAGFVPAFINDSIKDQLTYDGETAPENVNILLDQKVFMEYPAVTGINQVEQIFNEESQLAFAGEVTPEEAVEAITRRVQELNLGN